MLSKKRRLEVINTLCRICAKEDSNSIPIFGDIGKKQNLIGRIQTCLPITIHEDDNFPKKICLACLTKLDSFWDMYVLCKEAQLKIEKRFCSLRSQENLDQGWNFVPPVEEKLQRLSESSPVSYGDSAVIFLTRERTPPPPLPPTTTVTREPQAPELMTPITFITPAPAPAAPPPITEEVYPQALIQVVQDAATEQPVAYRNCPVPEAAPRPPTTTTHAKPRQRAPLVTVPQPMASPASDTPAQQSAPTPAKRQKITSKEPNDDKKMCTYCNKYFTDDIIDHHVSLHLRQSFNSCVECGKNFRFEESLLRHRCENKKDSETIDLDADDDELIIL